MRPGTALILEARGRRGVALTREGRFMRVSLPPGAAPGQEMELSRPRPAPAPGPRLRRVPSWRPRPAWAVALFLVLMVGLPLGSLWAAPRPQAYLSLDINPSLEMGVGRWGTVLSLRELNPEAGDLLGGIGFSGWGLKGRPVEAVVAVLVARAAARGYLSGPGSHAVVLGLAPAGDPGMDRPEFMRLLGRARGAAVAAAARQGAGAGVTAVSAPAEVRSQAQSLGLSVGKYVVLLVARESGLDLDPECLARTGVGRAIQEAGGRPQEVLQGLGQKRDLVGLGRKYQAEKDKDKGKGSGGGSGGPGSPQAPGGPAVPGGAGGGDEEDKDSPGHGGGNGQGPASGGHGQGQGKGKDKDQAQAQPQPQDQDEDHGQAQDRDEDQAQDEGRDPGQEED